MPTSPPPRRAPNPPRVDAATIIKLGERRAKMIFETFNPKPCDTVATSDELPTVKPSRYAGVAAKLAEISARDEEQHRHRVATSDEAAKPVGLVAGQCRMARAGLMLGVRELAALVPVSSNTIVRLERGESLYPRTIAAIRQALERAGVEFIGENGVRLLKGSSQ
ncbi:MAG: hypothetical protein PHI71_15335 [Acidiphilium sp.]|nr:hypothetical protein [Acidiphilium sp.]